MCKEQEPSRRDFLKMTSLLAAGLFLPKREIETHLPQDLTPERTVSYSVPPFGENINETVGIGYTHLEKTIGADNEPDGGHHIGTDFNWGYLDEDLGTPLKLIMDGVCVFAQEKSGRSLGTIAIFCHKLPDGSLIYSRYAHLESTTAEIGKNYRAGNFIGKMGKSGWENGFSHLHLDIANRATFEERYLTDDPYWYPRKAPLYYLKSFFLDPVTIIKSYLEPEQRLWGRGLIE
jgi:murein DD-endopeptidase MepM/ murein hydrolase activator NlpD